MFFPPLWMADWCMLPARSLNSKLMPELSMIVAVVADAHIAKGFWLELCHIAHPANGPGYEAKQNKIWTNNFAYVYAKFLAKNYCKYKTKK